VVEKASFFVEVLSVIAEIFRNVLFCGRSTAPLDTL
jgi:hypothetical protein